MVAGSLAAGSGVGAPVQGRLVDSLRPAPRAAAARVVHAAALGALVLAGEAGAPTGRARRLCGLLAGFAIPPTSSVLRSMWPHLLRDDPQLLQPAYALDSVLIELIFILGPLLTGLLTARRRAAGRADRLGRRA